MGSKSWKRCSKCNNRILEIEILGTGLKISKYVDNLKIYILEILNLVSFFKVGKFWHFNMWTKNKSMI